MMRRLLSVVPVMVATLMVGAATSPAPAQAAHSRIAPHQHFIATVNGGTGHPNPVVIRMACFGPIQPGQTGHPMSGQSVAVSRAHGSKGTGFTGDRGTSIGAFFGAPPPSGTASVSSYVSFTRYGQKQIPTSLQLPCSGSGTVSFVPLPLDPTIRDVAVPVSFVGQP